MRNAVFAEASSEFVLCIDSHILIAPGAISRLIRYVQDNPDTPDLLQGPLIYDDLRHTSTHMAPRWRDGMYGTWDNDPRGSAPEKGSILVLYNYAGAQRGHLAVVRTLVSSREIRVDHANWLNDGSIFVNNPVLDVSSANDWSAVRVFNLETGAWGSRVYPVRGFIGSDRDIGDKDGDLVASLAGGRAEIRTLIGEIY